MRLPAVSSHGFGGEASRGWCGAGAGAPMDPSEKAIHGHRNFTRILIEDKGYSLALHYRLAPQAGATFSLSRHSADLPDAPIEVLNGVVVDQARGFRSDAVVLMLQPPSGRRPSCSATTSPTSRFGSCRISTVSLLVGRKAQVLQAISIRRTMCGRHLTHAQGSGNLPRWRSFCPSGFFAEFRSEVLPKLIGTGFLALAKLPIQTRDHRNHIDEHS